MYNHFAIIALVHTVSGQSDIGCFVPGECIDSTFLIALETDRVNKCLEECRRYIADNGATCQDFTFYVEEQACLLYDSCETLDTSDCSDCLSGSVQCENLGCYWEGLSCQGTDVDNRIDLDSPQECADACAQTTNCVWATYYENTDLCVLTSDCEDLVRCDDCTTTNINNIECIDNNEDVRDVLLIIGGYDDSTLSSVEAIDFGGGGCSGQIAPLPEPNDFNPCLRDVRGAPISCGGNEVSDASECVTYSKDGDSWEPGPSMSYVREVGAQGVELSDGRFIVTSADTATFTTEILELDGEFSRGPDMSGADYETCAFEFEPGVLFVSGGQVFGSSAYLLDIETGESTQLPSMPNDRQRHACGKVVNGEGEVEVVLAGGLSDRAGTSDIFSLDTLTWRPGPFLPTGLTGPASSVFGDTFLVSGGRNSSQLYQDTLLEYDPVAESWITREERMEVARTFHGAVWVDRNDINC